MVLDVLQWWVCFKNLVNLLKFLLIFLTVTINLGPFVINSNETELTKNDYNWNKRTNFVFFDSPVGVGFSQNFNKVSNY